MENTSAKRTLKCTLKRVLTLKCKQMPIKFSSSLFLEVRALGEDLAWKVIKLWMEAAGRDLNNYQWRVVANAVAKCSLPIFCKLVFAEICR
jgi:hypothetical protein